MYLPITTVVILYILKFFITRNLRNDFSQIAEGNVLIINYSAIYIFATDQLTERREHFERRNSSSFFLSLAVELIGRRSRKLNCS